MGLHQHSFKILPMFCLHTRSSIFSPPAMWGFSTVYSVIVPACSAHTAAPKKGGGRARRSHLGLIVHVPAQNESISSFVSKMNFVDIAGYGDARRKTDESQVLFRESKLTRMSQGSLRGTSKVLLVSCLNPSFFQDGVYMLSLASQSCRRSHRTPLWFHDENCKFNKYINNCLFASIDWSLSSNWLRSKKRTPILFLS